MKCIYMIINLINGKKYIGSTTNFSRRKSRHLCLLKSGKHHSPSLQHSFNKYGIERFQFIILKNLRKDEICHIEEQKYLDEYLSYDKRFGYNIAKNAEAPHGLNNIRKVYKYDFSGNLIGVFPNCLEAANTVNCDHSGVASCCRGKYRYYKGFLWLYEDNLDNLNDRLYLANNKPKFTEQRLKNMSIAGKNRINNKKAIIQMDLEGNFIKEWPSTLQACNELGFSNGQICDYLKGKHKWGKGFHWKYKN